MLVQVGIANLKRTSPVLNPRKNLPNHASLFVRPTQVWQLDRAGQQAESVGMEAEDIQCRLLYRNERVTIACECGQMLTEERAVRSRRLLDMGFTGTKEIVQGFAVRVLTNCARVCL